MLCQVDNLANVCMWWLEDYQTGLYVNVLGILGVCVQSIGLRMDLYIKMWKILFIKIQKLYAFTDSFGNHLTITYSLGKLAIWQISFRKKTLECQQTCMQHAVNCSQSITPFHTREIIQLFSWTKCQKKHTPKRQQQQMTWTYLLSKCTNNLRIK